MKTRMELIAMGLLVLACAGGTVSAETPRARLMEARDLAYAANYRNDQDGLRSAIDALQPLAAGEESAYAHYYLSWSYWALVASQMAANDTKSALESAAHAVEHARSGLTIRRTDPEFHSMLANALIAAVILDRSRMAAVMPELREARERALALGPANPRVVMLDAGIIFNTPSDSDEPRARGLARWQEALKLFDAEANATAGDPIAPRWGQALANGWVAGLYLRMTPPLTDKARDAAATALRMRPDFWWVRDQILPQVAK